MLTLSLLKACSDTHSGFPLFFPQQRSSPKDSRTAPACMERVWVSASSRESAEMMVAFPSRNISTSESLPNGNSGRPVLHCTDDQMPVCECTALLACIYAKINARIEV